MRPLTVKIKAGERIYVNGAVIAADRRVDLTFLNEVSFLLASHALTHEETTTPLRQLYFIVQTMLIDPASLPQTRALFASYYDELVKLVQTESLLEGLRKVKLHVESDNHFEALKCLRSLFSIEDAIIKGSSGLLSPSQPETCGCA
jgi:flagellar protein FlbT